MLRFYHKISKEPEQDSEDTNSPDLVDLGTSSSHESPDRHTDEPDASSDERKVSLDEGSESREQEASTEKLETRVET